MERPGEYFVSGALAVVLRMSRLMGTAPLWFQKHGDGWRVRMAPRLSKIGCFIITIACLISASYLMILQGVRVKHYTMMHVAWIVSGILVLVTAAAMVYSAPRRMRCLMTCLSQVRKINSELNFLYRPRQGQNKQIGLFTFWMIFAIMITIINYVVWTLHLQINMSNYTLFTPWVTSAKLLSLIFQWIIQLGMIEFMLVVLHVRSSFISVNDCLKKLLRDNISNSKSDPVAVRRITSASAAYSSACNIVRDVDYTYGLTLMLFLAVIFLMLINVIYYSIRNLIFPNMVHVTAPQYQELIPLPYHVDTVERERLTIFIIFESVQLLLCIFYTFNLVMIIEPCHLIYKEMETTRELISKLFLVRSPQSVYDPLAVELQQFCRQFTLDEVSFKPLQITTIKRDLVLTMFTSMTTYLVIMINE